MRRGLKFFSGLKSDGQQFIILSRHFFIRFFQNDIVSFEEQMKEKMIASLVFLTILGGHMANSILMKYIFLLEDPYSWVEKSYFITFFMALLGFITMIEWDVIFPDRRDFSNLIPLPVKVRTFFFAKFASFCLFIALYSVGVNALGGFAFAYYLAQFHSKGVLYFLRYFLVHMVCASAANLFIFFLCVLIQGILMCFLSYNLYRKISQVFRFLLLTFFISLILFTLTESVSVSRSFSSFPSMKDSNAAFLYTFPPMWFVGLYETLVGNGDPFFRALWPFAGLSLLIVILGFFAAAEISYNRHVKKSLEVRRRKVYLKKMRAVLTAAFNGIFLRNPTQRAIFYFFGQTLSRSTLHKMRLFGSMAASSGLVLILLASVKAGLRQGPTSSKTLLAIPLILSFFLLVGIRILANVPSSLEANWVFQITEREQKRHYFSGLRKGIFFCTLLPLYAGLYVFYLWLWGWKPAFYHCLYGFVVSWVLLEVLFFKYPKIPFACTYVPGKAKIHLFWLVYTVAFLAYASIFSSVERAFFKNFSSFYYFYALMAILLLGLKIYNDFFWSKKLALVYDEEPEPVMVTFETLL